MRDGFFWDGYLHWARDLEEKDPEFADVDGEVRLFEPIFIRLSLSFDAELYSDLERFFREEFPLVEPEDRPSVLADRPEVAFLREYVFDFIEPLIGFQHALAERAPAEFFVYRPVARTLNAHNDGAFEVLDVGAPARVNPFGEVYSPSFPVGVRDADVFAAVIDNDIGYMHQRLRSAPGETRIAAMWLQARERLFPPGSPPSGTSLIHLGQIVDADWIDRLIAENKRDERRGYAEVNRSLHSRAAFQLPPPIEAHGAMVTDAAFGAEPGTAMGNVPILAVQLPPEAARDTSGTTSESYIVQGVRWIGFWARSISVDVPVVLNISYGISAGQKDGGKFIEAQIAREVQLAELYGQQIDVVFAFGNSANTRQVAGFTIMPEESKTLNWLVPAENAAPAFVEVRAVAHGKLVDVPRTVEVRLIDPQGRVVALAGSEGTTTVAAAPKVFENTGASAARIYNMHERAFGRGRPVQPGYTLCAVAPTRDDGRDTLPKAAAGDWQIVLSNSGDSAVRLILQVQRGDTAPGFQDGGFQTRFEGAVETVIEDGFVTVKPLPPITNEGTNSAFANVRKFHTSGAGRVIFGQKVRADYSGLGADWTTERQPDKLESVDRAFTRGILAAGTYSGTWAQLSGTSAAAALSSRAMAESRLGIA